MCMVRIGLFWFTKCSKNLPLECNEASGSVKDEECRYWLNYY
jgi:hypothetical protein